MSDLDERRVGRITGSRVGAILGVNPHQSRQDVLREMVRQALGAESEFTGNDATQWGNDHEVDALVAYHNATGLLVHGGQEFIPHPKLNFLGVTPDALVGTDGMAEVKCPWRSRYTSIAERPSYAEQIQLQLECTGRDWCDFVIWREFEPVIVERVERDPDWLDAHWDALASFIVDYRDTVADPERAQPHLDPKVWERTDPAWEVAAKEYQAADDVVKAATERRGDAKARLEELADGKPSRGFGVSLTERKGSVSWAKAVAAAGGLQGVDPEDFRGASSWTVRAS